MTFKSPPLQQVLGEDLHLADCTAALANPAGPFLPGPTAPSAPSAFRTSMAQYYSGPAVTFRPVWDTARSRGCGHWRFAIQTSND